VRLNSLGYSELASHLRSKEGLLLELGPFIVSIRSTCKHVVQGLYDLYDNYPLANSSEYIDFKVRVYNPWNLHRLAGRPQALFSLDHIIPFKPLPLDQAFPMLEWGLNWCVSSNAHQYLIIHAAVVAKNGHCIIFPAPPGSGKSTLCAGMISKGWQLLSDELALISTKTGEVAPFPRPISLKNQSIPVMQEFAPDIFINRASLDTAKGTVAHMKVPEMSIRLAHQNAVPRLVVFPRYEAGAETVFTSYDKATAFMQLAENAFNYSLLGDKGFAVTAGVIDQIDSYSLVYSDLQDVINQFETMIG
jgi:HprK-related kinase A